MAGQDILLSLFTGLFYFQYHEVKLTMIRTSSCWFKLIALAHQNPCMYIDWS